MPRAPILPAAAQTPQGPPPPSGPNMLMAAADLHANGELGPGADPSRSMPTNPAGVKVGFPTPHHKNPRHTKSPLG